MAHEAAALALAWMVLTLGASPAGALDGTPNPVPSCPPDVAGAPAHARNRNPRLALALRLSSDTVMRGQPLQATLTIRPLDGPLGLVVSRPGGARWLTIVDSATGLAVPTRPEFIESITTIHTENFSEACPMTFAVDLRRAFDLAPGRYVLRAHIRPTLRRDLAWHLDVFPDVFSNDVILTVTP